MIGSPLPEQTEDIEAAHAEAERQERIRWAHEHSQTWSWLADHIQYDSPPDESVVRRSVLVYNALTEHVDAIYRRVAQLRYPQRVIAEPLDSWTVERYRDRGEQVSVTLRDRDGDRETFEYPLAYLWTEQAQVEVLERQLQEENRRRAEAAQQKLLQDRAKKAEIAERAEYERLKAKFGGAA